MRINNIYHQYESIALVPTFFKLINTQRIDILFRSPLITAKRKTPDKPTGYCWKKCTNK